MKYPPQTGTPSRRLSVEPRPENKTYQFIIKALKEGWVYELGYANYNGYDLRRGSRSDGGCTGAGRVVHGRRPTCPHRDIAGQS